MNPADATYFYQIAINAGAALQSQTDIALNGTYSIDDPSQFVILVEYVSCKLDNEFTDGSASKQYMDQDGNLHVFSVAQFVAFGKAIGAYVDSLRMTRIALSLGQDVPWPSNQVTIA